MPEGDRYDVSGFPEAQFEPGSSGKVLKNLLGLTSITEMDDCEARALEMAIDTMVRKYDDTHRFKSTDICNCHRIWLGGIYEWAGQYRRVNVTKGGFLFAAAGKIPELMTSYEARF